MKKSMKFATALAGAAVVVIGGTAFTNSITGFDDAMFNGYDSTTVTGVTETDTNYTYVDGAVKTVTWVLSDQISTEQWGRYQIVATVEGASANTCVPTAYAANGAGPEDDTPASILCTWTNAANGNSITLSVTTSDLVADA